MSPALGYRLILHLVPIRSHFAEMIEAFTVAALTFQIRPPFKA
jgi:hypothetical protein